MCPHEEKLTAWLLGDLPPEEQQAMTRHLDGCDSCRAVRDELSAVLTPLHSGLAKDLNLRIEAPSRIIARPSAPGSWLWRSPHEGLKRAAILTVSFGTLFALISTVYQRAQRQSVPESSVTHVEFKKTAGEAPAPALQPLAEVEEAQSASDRLAAEAERRTAPFVLTSKPVPHPALPAEEPRMPALRRLVNADPEAKKSEGAVASRSDGAATATAAAVEAAPAPAATAAPAKAVVARRERSKAAALPRPPADLKVKPVLLAGLSAPTNAVPTNAVPTNAVAPAVKRMP